uniref:Putative tail protein n=1 Tax=viral metagenome TaxID=1070528 RepID=A0A6M3MCI2_9ZZZZ
MTGMEKIKLKDKMRIRGRVTATVRDAKTGEILEIIHGKNLVTDDGEELFMKWMNGEAPNFITYCAVGSDNTAPAEGDHALTAEIGRILITDQTRVTTTITYSTFFGIADCNGNWEEEGLLNAAVAGTLVTHTLFAAPIVKDATKTVTVDHELIMAGA